MKFLLGYSAYRDNYDVALWNENWLKRLRQHSVNIKGFCLTLNPPGPALAFKNLDQLWKRRDPQLMKMYRGLLNELEGVDVFINYNGINLHPEFVRVLPTFNVYCCFDDPESSDWLSRPVAAAYDLCLVGNIAELETYRRWKILRVAFLPNGFRREDYNPRLTYRQILSGHRDIEVVFIGDLTSPWRRVRLETFAAAFPRGAFFGRGWPAGILPESKKIPLLQRAKIGINIHNSTGPINFRTYYLPANGVMEICDNKDFLGKIFRLDQEVVGYNDIHEAIELTKYYLHHDAARKKIALAGWRRVLRDYNETVAFGYLIRQVSSYFLDIMPKQRLSSPAEVLDKPSFTSRLQKIFGYV